VRQRHQQMRAVDAESYKSSPALHGPDRRTPPLPSTASQTEIPVDRARRVVTPPEGIPGIKVAKLTLIDALAVPKTAAQTAIKRQSSKKNLKKTFETLREADKDVTFPSPYELQAEVMK
jgi:hypothetical protein